MSGVEVAQPGPSRTATVADESEELTAEAGTVVPSPADVPTENGEDGNAANGVKEGEEREEAEEEEEDPDRIPDNACETLYIQNLNEKVRIPGESSTSCRCPLCFTPSCLLGVEMSMRRAANSLVITETLASLFKPYRPILPITAHRNVRMRGQAFISFGDKEEANRARREVNEFPLYGKPMVSPHR